LRLQDKEVIHADIFVRLPANTGRLPRKPVKLPPFLLRCLHNSVKRLRERGRLQDVNGGLGEYSV
jgi:hypothetical protein